MKNLYTKPSKEEQLKNMNPKKETIQFLLSYSKALCITEYQKMKFDTVLN
ncbi:hypothetical protein L1I30_07400 [Gillisia sp. M10.2A]|uniref:Uncharacterized protein n=1 Tax=Gillisia lutea TaxID=2909668 RepID=A0ABS9EF34_9FLAO|nr:hypothetical protein [Gillisia lutea]MCF4101485.1 hypothetical protein [Gillisia lutea]